MPQVFFLTGSSRGLGRQIAEAVLAAGHNLVATARQPESLADLADRYGSRILPVALDVTDPEAATAAVAAGTAAQRGHPLNRLALSHDAIENRMTHRRAAATIVSMLADHFPLLRLRLTTPQLELRLPTVEELAELADLTAKGIHDPDASPFIVRWTDLPPAEAARSVVFHHRRTYPLPAPARPRRGLRAPVVTSGPP